MRSADFFDALRDALAAPRPPSPGEDPATLRRAAVLAPFYEEGDAPGLILVERSGALGNHPGQIAFPGGARDPGEDDLACALRESREEIGLDPAEVEVLGRLAPRPTVTGFLVSPVVGRLRRWPVPFVPAPAEVASILTVPVARLVEPGVLRVATFEGGRTVDFFDLGDHVVWGATARMIRELLERVLGRALEPGGEVPLDRVRW